MLWYLKKVRDKFGSKFFRDMRFKDPEPFFRDVLGLGNSLWPEIANDLNHVFEHKTNEVIKLDGVGSGKTTFLTGLILYTTYLLGHLKDPAIVFPGMMPRSKIAIVIMSLREQQAKNLIFDVIKTHFNNCRWFKLHYRYEEEGSRVLKFNDQLYIISGSSSETVPIGYNVILGVADEGDWMIKQTHISDSLEQLENIYNAMKDRIETRFFDVGTLALVSSMRLPDGFIAKRAKKIKGTSNAYITRRPQWMVKPGKWNPYFVVNTKTFEVVVEKTSKCWYDPDGEHEFEERKFWVSVPSKLRDSYDRNPRRFLRDRASVVTYTDVRYVLRPDLVKDNVAGTNPITSDGMIADWFKPDPDAVYYSHVDLASTRDGLGLSIGHQDNRTTIIDLLYAIDPKEMGKIDFERVRQIFYALRDRGFIFGLITFDSYQSYDTRVILEKKGFPVDIFSVDKDARAYDAWLEANYSGEFEIPLLESDNPAKDYMSNVQSLMLRGSKVDHAKGAYKDLTDSVAGTTFHCRTLGVMNVVTAFATTGSSSNAPRPEMKEPAVRGRYERISVREGAR